MTHSCPFCGDERKPANRWDTLLTENASVFWCECECCGAQGPVASTLGAALVLWDERRSPGDSAAFRALCSKISP